MADNTESPLSLIGDGVLPREGLLLISGPPKVRKSFLAANLALALAYGRSFAGFKITEPRSVLLISAEGGRTPNRIRLQRMWNSAPVPPDAKLRFHGSFAWTHALDTKEGEEALIVALEEYKPEVLILDPLVRFHRGEENSATDMARFFRLLRRLMKAFGFAVILVHHTGKNIEQGVRGSSAIQAEYDSAIQMRKADDGAFLSFDLRHEETPTSRRVRFNSSTFWFESKHDSVVVQALRQSGAPLTRKVLIENMIAAGLAGSKSYAYKLITSAVQDGRVIEKDLRLHEAT